MRILWIGKRPGDGAAGDEVFDRNTIAACRRRGHEIDLFHPAQVSRPAELANLLAGLPHYRTRFAAAANAAGIAQRLAAYDAVIASWEPFDVLARGLRPPSVMILHNITSRSLPSLFPANRLARLAAARARAWERRCYRRTEFAAIAALSRRDLAYLQTLPDAPPLLLLPPGMPPCVPLAEDATLQPELVLSGTFDWVPKRRDILRFATEHAAGTDRLAVRAGPLPPAAAQLLQPAPQPSAAESAAHLRLGVITDRFEAGHKLKTMAYIANNAIVLSFAEVAFDFADIPDHDLFIRRIDAAGEIPRHLAALSALGPAALRDRFRAFQARCAQRFTWDTVAETLLRAASRAGGQQQAA
jgi:hypothetical protein